jgi:hypothetical protein
MEVQNSLHIQILTTLETIERVNKSIARHKGAPEPDQLAITQWTDIKENLIGQLQELLTELDIKLSVAA